MDGELRTAQPIGHVVTQSDSTVKQLSQKAVKVEINYKKKGKEMEKKRGDEKSVRAGGKKNMVTQTVVKYRHL